MDQKWFDLLMAIIPVLGVILTSFVVPYIKELIGNEKLEKYEYWVNMAVRAAEMMWTESGKGTEKKEYVVQFLTETFNKNKINITDEQMNLLIEAAVKQLHLEEN